VFMLSVTEKAVDALAKSLDESEAEGDQSLRLSRSPQGEYGLDIDQERDGDQVVRQEKRPILLIDQEVSNQLDGAVLDLVEAPEGIRLTLRMEEDNPAS
jgi:Fe-S cluster assembly iron-binding protein IscA